MCSTTMQSGLRGRCNHVGPPRAYNLIIKTALCSSHFTLLPCLQNSPHLSVPAARLRRRRRTRRRLSVPGIPFALEEQVQAGYGMGKRKKKEEEEEQALSLVNVPGDLLPEILSRVPYQSLCRFKCVSMAWLKLCSDPAVRKRSPQTLSGFFCKASVWKRGIRFLNLSGRGRPLVDPSLSFLHGYECVTLLNCCGGILLCSGWDPSMKRRVYLVCNPATQEIWAALPAPDTQHPQVPCVYTNYKTCLFFNPAVPGRFAVSVLFCGHVNIEVKVYSSDTGEWASMASGWDPTIELLDCRPGHICFLNGTLHFIAYYDGEDDSIIELLVTVDMDGSAWRTISMPTEGWNSIIGQSQGHLYCMGVEHHYLISVWVLKDYASGHQDWTLKHSVSVLELLGRPCRKPGEFYWLVAIHPERNLLFLAGGVEPEETLMSYDMDSKKLNVICTLEEYDMRTFWPYTPCFAERPSATQ